MKVAKERRGDVIHARVFHEWTANKLLQSKTYLYDEARSQAVNATLNTTYFITSQSQVYFIAYNYAGFFTAHAIMLRVCAQTFKLRAAHFEPLSICRFTTVNFSPK